MGLRVVLEAEMGDELQAVEDPTNVLHRVLPNGDDRSFQCLGMIDWHGDTVFNRLQVPQFIAEWDRIIPKATAPDEAALMMQIRTLAESVATNVHLYLKFYGD